MVEATSTPRTSEHRPPGKRTFAFGLLTASLIFEAWATALIVLRFQNDGLEFYSELLILAALAVATEPLVLVVRRVHVFRTITVVRLVLVFAILATIGVRSAVISVLFSIPIIFQIATYDDGGVRWIYLIGATVMTITATLLGSAEAPVSQVVLFHVTFAFLILASEIAAVLLNHYREVIVHHSQVIHSLQTSVTNLSNANRAFQSYADNLESESAEKERNRIISELHDTIGYALTNVNVMMKAGRSSFRRHRKKWQVFSTRFESKVSRRCRRSDRLSTECAQYKRRSPRASGRSTA